MRLPSQLVQPTNDGAGGWQTGDTVLYLGNVEVTKIGATTTFRRYIGGFLLQTIPVGGTTSNEYLFHDQLSLVPMTDIFIESPRDRRDPDYPSRVVGRRACARS